MNEKYNEKYNVQEIGTIDIEFVVLRRIPHDWMQSHHYCIHMLWPEYHFVSIWEQWICPTLKHIVLSDRKYFSDL